MNAVMSRRDRELLAASFSGDQEKVGLLLRKRTSVNVNVRSTGDGRWTSRTSLHLAVQGGHRKIVKMLLEAGANPNAQEETWKWTPLHLARSIAVAQLLIQHGARVDARDSWGRQPISRAAFWGRLEFVKMLVAHGARADACDYFGETALHSAVFGHWKTMVKFLITAGADVNAQRVFQWPHTPLTREKREIIKLLKTLPRVEDRLTPLHTACQGMAALKLPKPVQPEGHRGIVSPSMVQLLLELGADINARNYMGETPLDLAVENGHRSIAAVLRRHGGKRLAPQKINIIT